VKREYLTENYITLCNTRRFRKILGNSGHNPRLVGGREHQNTRRTEGPSFRTAWGKGKKWGNFHSLLPIMARGGGGEVYKGKPL